MAVPNTTTFTLQDVVDEVNPTTDDLVDCFADAQAGGFDATYSGSKDNLLNFRNYASLVSVLISSTNRTTSVIACDDTASSTFYATDSPLAVSSVVYTSIAGDTVLNGNSEWRKYAIGTVQITSVGVVLGFDTCA